MLNVVYILISFCFVGAVTAAPVLTEDKASVIDAIKSLGGPGVQESEMSKASLCFEAIKNEPTLNDAHIVWRFLAALIMTGDSKLRGLHDQIVKSGYALSNHLLDKIGYQWGVGVRMKEADQRILDSRFQFQMESTENTHSYNTFTTDAVWQSWKARATVVTKFLNQTSEHARRLGLAVSEKPDSQDICFVPDGDYRSFITKWAPQASAKGEIIHIDGRVLGEHQGIIHFTIGQRRGLGVTWHESLYVIRLEPDTQRVIVGPREALACTKIEFKEINWLDPPSPSDRVWVKIRSTQEPVPAKMAEMKSDTASVVLLEPEYGVSPGQACVVYRGTQVLGGGWII